MDSEIPTGPTLQRERELWKIGYAHVAGVDEAGRGALAGPVVAAAVIVPEGATLDGIWGNVDDSKRLKPDVREELAIRIRDEALSWGIGAVPASIIDSIGIAPATRMAMQSAIEQLSPDPDFLLIDWVRLPQVNLPQQSPAKADSHFASVAAASILAKVHRDSLLVDSSRLYPTYRFESNKGYGTAVHLAALKEHGPCPIHRRTFAPLSRWLTLFDGV